MAATVKGYISDNLATEFMRLQKLGTLSATNTAKLNAWKAMKNKSITNAFSGSSMVNPTSRPTSSWTPVTQTQAKTANKAYADKNAPAPTPSGSGSIYGSSSGSGSYGGSLPPVNPTPQVPVNIDLYNMRTAQQLMDEAGAANKAVYNPKYQGIEALMASLGQGQQAAEADIEKKYGTQVGDLQRIYGTLNSQYQGSMGAVDQGYQQAQQGVQAATDQGLGQQTRNFDRSSQMLQDMTNLAGVGNWAQQGQADLGRDNSFSQALLNNTNQNAQSMNSLARQAANTWMTSLNEGTKSQGAMQAGQAQLARDQNITDLEKEYLSQTQQGQQKLYDTQSESASDLYKLVQSMQSEDWTKYMDTREQAFSQGFQNAGLFQTGQTLSLQKAQQEQDALLAALKASTSSSSSSSQQTRLDQSLNYLGEAIKDPKMLQDAQYVMRLLMNPTKISNAISNPAGSVAGGTTFEGLYGDNGDAQSQYAARVYESMKDRGYVSGLNDPTWSAMQNAIQILLQGTKKV